MSSPKTGKRDRLIGKVLEDRYELVERIGEGGMGRVYRARQLRMGRDVAVKVLRVHRELSQSAVARFEREARVASMLRHPNSIVTFDFGTSPYGLYIAMELLEGNTLYDRLRAQRTLPPEVAARIGAGIAASLAEAHEHGIVHRDLKPQNIFLHRVRGMDVIKVLDFGIAKLNEVKVDANGRDAQSDLHDTGENPGVSTTTAGDVYQTVAVAGQGNAVLGTCMYMAPEQIRAKRLDGRCDIYALGCILYEMLSGQPPYMAEEVRPMLEHHLRSPVPQLPPSIDEELRILVTVMMSKDRERRPRSADEVLSALLRYLGEARQVGAIAIEPFDPPAGRSSAPSLDVDGETADASDDFPVRDMVGATSVARPHQARPTHPSPQLAAPPAATVGEPDKPEPTTGPTTRPQAHRSAPPTTPRARPSLSPRRPAGLAHRWQQLSLLVRGGLLAALSLVILLVVWLSNREAPPAPDDASTEWRTGAFEPDISDVAYSLAPRHWRRIEAGRTRMGTDDAPMGQTDQSPRHEVRLTRPFAIKATEVTRAEWRAVLGLSAPDETPCSENCAAASISWWDSLAWLNALSEAERLPPCYELSDCEGTPGDHFECGEVQFVGLDCRGYRLPTEAEWEYAARAVDDSAYTLKDREGLPPARNALAPVGTDRPNAWGLHELLGSVTEWVWDRYDPGYYARSPAVDPTGPETGELRVRRGCAWHDPPSRCRYAVRMSARPDEQLANAGFRPVITIR